MKIKKLKIGDIHPLNGLRITGILPHIGISHGFSYEFRSTIEHYDNDGLIQFLDNEENIHREDGPANIWPNGDVEWFIRGKRLNPIKAVKSKTLKKKYPKLIESMIIYSVHNS
jgi:hypothetical protein